MKSTKILLFLAILSFICGFSREILIMFQADLLWIILLSPSLSISLAAIIIRLRFVDPSKFTEIILNTDISLDEADSGSLKPLRFLNTMPIAMITCSVADIVIVLSLMGGVVFFLLAHILHIIAFSGIIHLHPKYVFRQEERNLSMIPCIILGSFAISFYFIFIFDPSSFLSFFVIPYVVVLILIALVPILALTYRRRSKLFRKILCLGGIFFLISDSILAYWIFYSSFLYISFFIGITYLTSLILLQYAILFIDEGR